MTAEAHIGLGQFQYKVVQHWLWPRWAKGSWEPETLKVFVDYLSCEGVLVDVGAWIGPTVMYGQMAGAKKIYAIEPNPPSFQHLQQNVKMNGELAAITQCDQVCIGPQGVVPFGENKTTSKASIRTSRFQVLGMRLSEYLGTIDHEPTLINIDIEGAEHLVADDVENLMCVCPILLSLHPPMYNKVGVLLAAIDKFADMYDFYDISTREEVGISAEQVKERCLSSNSHPSWGTRWGNFFQILLKL